MTKRLLITADAIGRSDVELGRILMKNFLYALARSPEKPECVMLANEAVRLACVGSASLGDLILLSEDGVTVRACGTCLDYLGLKDRLAVGEIGTMPDMVAAVVGEGEIITIA